MTILGGVVWTGAIILVMVVFDMWDRHKDEIRSFWWRWDK